MEPNKYPVPILPEMGSNILIQWLKHSGLTTLSVRPWFLGVLKKLGGWGLAILKILLYHIYIYMNISSLSCSINVEWTYLMKSHDGAIINGIFYGINTKTPEWCVYIYIYVL